MALTAVAERAPVLPPCRHDLRGVRVHPGLEPPQGLERHRVAEAGEPVGLEGLDQRRQLRRSQSSPLHLLGRCRCGGHVVASTVGLFTTLRGLEVADLLLLW